MAALVQALVEEEDSLPEVEEAAVVPAVATSKSNNIKKYNLFIIKSIMLFFCLYFLQTIVRFRVD